MKVNNYTLKAPVEVIETQLGIPQNYKQKCIDEVYRLGNSVNKQTKYRTIRTSWKIWEQSKIFDKLLKNILSSIKNLRKDTLDDRGIINLVEAWGAIYKKDDYIPPHFHTYCDLSFTYYLKSDGKTPLVFSDCDFQITPSDDTLIIFPAYLMHHVPTHTGKKDRICIAGNTQSIFKN